MKLSFRWFALTILLAFVFPRYGEGQVAGNTSPNGNAGDYNGSVTTAGSYDPFTGSASRAIEDIVVPGSVGAYPLAWTRRLNTRGPASQSASNFGQAGGWSHSYDWQLVVYHPFEPPIPPSAPEPPPDTRPHATLTYPDGRSVVWGVYESGDDSFYQPEGVNAADQAPFGMRDRFKNYRDGYHYELWLADGGVVKFIKPYLSYPKCIATEIVDPYGQVTSLRYDSGRLDKVVEPGGRYLKISYRDYQSGPGVDTFIDKVEAYDGEADHGLGHITQTVQYHYDQFTFTPGHPLYYLTSVDYDDGTHASYGYQRSNRPPLQNNDPDGSVAGLVRTCREVRFAGPMKNIMYEYRGMSAGENIAEVGWGQISQEKNILGQVLSEVEYQSYIPGQPYNIWRKEHRPGKNVPGHVTREFRYNNPGPASGPYATEYSDFLDHRTHIDFSFNAGEETYHCLITDARQKTTDKQTEPIFNATVRVIYPPTEDSPNGAFVETIYTDPARPHYIASRQDENGYMTTYRRTPTHEVEYILYPDGSSESFTYNIFKQIEDHTMTSGGVEHFRYDTDMRGLKTLYWPPATLSDDNPAQHPTRYVYYTAADCPGRFYLIDRLWKVTDPLGHTTTYDYNARGQVTRVTHHDTRFTQSVYNDDGTLWWTADENHPSATALSGSTVYEYDEYKRLQKVTDPLGHFTQYDYTPVDNPGLGPLSHTTSSVYLVTSPTGKKTQYHYDANFRRTTTIQGFDTPDAATTLQHYDEVGNVDWIQDPRAQFTTTYVYDARNRQTRITVPTTPSETTTIIYDPAGNKLVETRPDTAVRTWAYDQMNRLWYTHDWHIPPVGGVAPAQVEPATAVYGRDAAGNVHTITDRKGAVYVYEHDHLNRKISCTYPLDASDFSRTEAWHYDIAGNLDYYTNTANETKRFHYDSRNRQERSWWDGNVGPDIVTRYDDASNIKAVLANSAARAVMRGGLAPDDNTYAETKVYIEYDGANRRKWEDQVLEGQTPRRIQAVLNDDGTRQNLQITGLDPLAEDPLSIAAMPSGGPYFVAYDYTGRNQVRRIAGEDWFFEYTYDPSGNMTQRLAQYNGRTSLTECPTGSYDARNRPTLWRHTSDGQTLETRNYKYDNANREVATWRDEANDQGQYHRGERFSYEPANQLSSVAYNADSVWTSNPTGATRTVNYAYTPDKLNRSSMTDTPQSGAPVVTHYSASLLNQYKRVGRVPELEYVYDTKFNLTETDLLSVTYDAANQIVSATYHNPLGGGQQIAFAYDGLGRCVKQTIGPVGVSGVATLFIYDGWKAIAEFDAWNFFHAWNVYGPGADEILVRNTADEKYDYIRFLQDWHGNVAFLLDNDGHGIEKYTYDAFGSPTITDWSGNARESSHFGHRFLFQGRNYFHELGVYDYRHRFYHPELGRFLQIDPKGFEAGDMNLFRYVGDDPVDGSDPMGLAPGDPFGSPFDAALDVHNFINPTSISLNREYGSVIYRLNGQYFATEPRLGSGRDSTERNRPPDGATRVGDYHSHGDYSRAIYNHRTHKFDAVRAKNKSEDQWGSDDFSKKDKREYDRLAKNNPEFRGYLGTPSGKMRVHNPVRGKPDDPNSGKNQRDNDAQTRREATANMPSDRSNAPSAAQVDALHQATGVPSLGAEAVNFAPGKP